MKINATIYNKCKFIQFPTKDGLVLPGLFFNIAGSKKAAIFLHGTGSSSIFYYDNYSLAERLNEKNISLLMFNNRGAHIIKKMNVYKQDENIERKKFGMAYELIKECVFDIEGALDFLTGLGYEEIYLIGGSTGANKICVYNFYKPVNRISKYVLIAGSDDVGIYYNKLGKTKYKRLLKESRLKIKSGQGEKIVYELLPEDVFSYKSFYDMLNPDGDYNVFPFLEIIINIKLSKKPLFNYFKKIDKPSLVIYGENDEYLNIDVKKIIDILKKNQPSFRYEIINHASHNFTGEMDEVGKIVAKWL